MFVIETRNRLIILFICVGGDSGTRGQRVTTYILGEIQVNYIFDI